LRGQSGDYGKAETLEAGDCFEISLYARASAGIRTGNGQYVWKFAHGAAPFNKL
jgi:hypothetical protein